MEASRTGRPSPAAGLFFLLVRVLRLAPELAPAFGDEAVAAGFDAALRLLEEGVAGEAGRDRVEELDHRGAGPAQEAAARPVEAGVERHRQAGHGEVLVEVRDTVFIGRRRAGGAARALREDND